MDPRLFLALEALAKTALDYGGNHAAVRSAVGRVVGEIRKIAGDKVGHDTVEAVALSKLLQRTGEQPMARGASSLMATNIYLLRRLSEDQQAGADLIRYIWTAFGRFLTMRAKTMGDAGGHASRPLGPFEVMSQSTYDIWREVYVPWVQEAHLRWVSSRDGKTKHRHTSLVLHVIVEDKHPAMIDKGFRLVAGTTLRTVKEELDDFNGARLAVRPPDPPAIPHGAHNAQPDQSDSKRAR